MEVVSWGEVSTRLGQGQGGDLRADDVGRLVQHGSGWGCHVRDAWDEGRDDGGYLPKAQIFQF